MAAVMAVAMALAMAVEMVVAAMAVEMAVEMAVVMAVVMAVQMAVEMAAEMAVEMETAVETSVETVVETAVEVAAAVRELASIGVVVPTAPPSIRRMFWETRTKLRATCWQRFYVLLPQLRNKRLFHVRRISPSSCHQVKLQYGRRNK